MSTSARLRDHEVLQRQLAELAGEAGDCGEGDALGFRRGAWDALRWVTEGGPGPLTGCLDGPAVSVQAIVRELAAAEAIIYGRPSRHRAYCAGAEHALMWAQSATASPPLPQRSPAVQGRPN
jgi:hypothetical protein